MASERFVVMGLAPVRSTWFREVSRWATSAALPLEFVKTMSVEEVRARLRAGRPYSALLVEDSVPGLDRDLVDLALESGCAVVIVDTGRVANRWSELGASAKLPADFARGDLLQTLTQAATPLTAATTELPMTPAEHPTGGYRGRVVAVTGPSGSGRSIVAMAVAQGLGADPRHAELVCLADLALHADQALLHDARDVVPGILELVEAHRGGAPTTEAVRALTWRVAERGYHLLLGLRRHRDWTSLRPRAFEGALDSLRRGFRLVVADVDDDLEGERQTGSVDLEERNLMARVVVQAADVVLVVGQPGLRGVHGMLRVTRDLLDHGVAGDRILPIVNRAPRSPRARSEITRAFGELLATGASKQAAPGVPSPVHLNDRHNLDQLLRDGARLPDGWLAPVCSAVAAVLDSLAEEGARAATTPEPVAVVPGTLGSWTDQDDGGARGEELGG